MTSIERRISRRYAACLGGIDFTCGLENRAAADGVLVLLDGAASQQINLASEKVFELLMQFEEIPAEVHAGLKRHQQVYVAAAARFATREGAEHFQPGDPVALAERREAKPHLVQRRRQYIGLRGHMRLTSKHSARSAIRGRMAGHPARSQRPRPSSLGRRLYVSLGGFFSKES